MKTVHKILLILTLIATLTALSMEATTLAGQLKAGIGALEEEISRAQTNEARRIVQDGLISAFEARAQVGRLSVLYPG